ncbi:hypothetical protein L915_19134 [Phytophthora nicotianae]|uniref:Uncharacterized protein n=1 Tax=Phytophthora nicotianae TaxID=4792 RepID=W2FVD2_PHYNI|nr:hypothetical protein L915_19134 [Phytophthora nicotianae]
MARGARSVTCRDCGCLNFSSEHEVCDKCRSKTLAFRPTARRLATSSSASNNQRKEDSDSRVPSIGKKRRYDETRKASDKKSEDKNEREKSAPIPAPTPPAKKQPDVIDLVSSDEEDDNEVQQVIRESLTARRREDTKEDNNEHVLFQSRVFPTVPFVASDFPSLEQGTQMRKKAADKGPVHSQPTGGKAAIKSGLEKASTSVSQPTPPVSRVAKEMIESKPEPRPPIEEKEKTAPVEATAKKAENETTKTNVESTVDSAITASTASKVKDKQEKTEIRGEEDPFFQSRVFDAVEFAASDFATVFDGLAVARRSHPPPLSSSTAAISTSVRPAATAPTLSAGPKANKATKSATVAAPTATTASKPTTKTAETSSIQEASVPNMPTATAANRSTSSASAKVSPPVPKASTTTAEATAVQPSSAQPTQKPTVVTPPTKTPSTQPTTPSTKTPLTQSKAAAVPSSTKADSTPRQTNPAPDATVKPVITTKAPAQASPSAVVAKTVPATPVPTKAKETAETAKPPAFSVPVSVVGSAALKGSSAGNRQVNGSANVLWPKKKHPDSVQRTNKEKQRSKSTPTSATPPADVDGVEFVKVNASPREILPVEPPVLGYCSPEFLAFMRECGGDDGDEEDDPEEESRSQLKLLNVVDLTNLSDSEDSDVESPTPTPRGNAPHESLPSNGPAGSASQAAVSTNAKVSGTGTWYVPTLESERKRSQPEKVMCELCEAKGLPSRLIRCPTCTKYYHKKCAKENGDENICWNCELGSMIDDSELDAEHAKHDSEYLAYLKAIRRSPSPEGEADKQEVDEEQDGEAAGEDVGMATPAEGEDSEGNAKKAGKRWMEFIGDATADIDATYHEVTNRIAAELRDEEKKRLYSRGFVSREEFEQQMTEVEEYYINEEARLQQLEREKALEAKKAAEARKAQEVAEQVNGDQSGGTRTTENNAPSVPTVVQDGDVSATTIEAPSSATSGPTSATTAPMSVPAATPSSTPHPAVPPPTLVPVGVPTAAFYAAFSATAARPAPPSKPL